MYHRERQLHAPAGNSKIKKSPSTGGNLALSLIILFYGKHEQIDEDKEEAYEGMVRLGFGWIERGMEGGGHGFLKAMRSTRSNYGQFRRR